MSKVWVSHINKLGENFFRKLWNSSSLYFFIYLGFFSILPLFLLSFFNNPGSDDFDYEFKRPFSQIIQTQIELYNGWSGRYFSIGFMTINPDIFIEYSFSKFYPIIIISLFVLSLFCFFKSIFSKENNLMVASLVGFFVFLFCFQVPDMCQTFFWYSSSICYQFGIVLFLFFTSFFIAYNRRKKIGFLFFALITVIAAIGSNEILMLMLLILSIWFIIFKLRSIKKIDFHEKALFVIILFFSILVIASPGNNVRLMREGIIDNHNLLTSLIKTFFYSISYIIHWFPIILLSTLIYNNQLKDIYCKLKDQNLFIHPLLCLVVLVTLIFPCFFVGFWTYNSLLPNRAINSIYFFFLLFALYFLFCVFHFLKSKFNFDLHLTKSTKVGLGFILICLMFSNTPISQAYFDLFSGKAYKYNKELEIRNKVITSSNQKQIAVPMLINCPKTIYNSDVMGLTSDKNNWKNVEISLYYQKVITAKPLDTTFTE